VASIGKSAAPRPLHLAHLSHDHRGDRAADGGRQRGEVAEARLGGTGRSTTMTPPSPEHGEAPAQAHPFPQERDGEQRDEQGLREGQRIDLRQGEHREGVEGREPRDHGGDRAQRDPAGSTGRSVPGAGSRIIIPMARGKENSVEKKMSWKGENPRPEHFTTASWVA
jgi:hypothetical protein